jgi:ketosteroid isomerase-like protein
MDPLDVARRMIAAIEAGDRRALETMYADDAVQHELPNALVPKGIQRDKPAILEAFDRGAALMATQCFEITNAVTQGRHAAVEADFVGETKSGKTFRARFAMFFEVVDGKIVSQRNYDCFDPF